MSAAAAAAAAAAGAGANSFIPDQVDSAAAHLYMCRKHASTFHDSGKMLGDADFMAHVDRQHHCHTVTVQQLQVGGRQTKEWHFALNALLMQRLIYKHHLRCSVQHSRG
jgi:hypothetical protein